MKKVCRCLQLDRDNQPVVYVSELEPGHLSNTPLCIELIVNLELCDMKSSCYSFFLSDLRNILNIISIKYIIELQTIDSHLVSEFFRVPCLCVYLQYMCYLIDCPVEYIFSIIKYFDFYIFCMNLIQVPKSRKHLGVESGIQK